MSYHRKNQRRVLHRVPNVGRDYYNAGGYGVKTNYLPFQGIILEGKHACHENHQQGRNKILDDWLRRMKASLFLHILSWRGADRLQYQQILAFTPNDLSYPSALYQTVMLYTRCTHKCNFLLIQNLPPLFRKGKPPDKPLRSNIQTGERSYVCKGLDFFLLIPWSCKHPLVPSAFVFRPLPRSKLVSFKNECQIKWVHRVRTCVLRSTVV